MTDVVHIVDLPEYGDTEPLVAGEHLASQPAFWLAHLMITMGDLSADPDGYGIDQDLFDAMLDRLCDAGRWTTLRVPFGGGHTALVVYADFEDENSVDFVVRHPAWGRLGHLGQCGPESAGPGLSWQELTTIAADVPEDASELQGLVDPEQRLLLLLPMLGDAATPEDAWSLVGRALAHCGIPAETAPRLARELLGTDTDDRRVEPSWARDEDSPVAVCSSPYSPRRVQLALGISPDQTRALAEALRGGTS